MPPKRTGGTPKRSGKKRKTVTYHDEEGEKHVIGVDILFGMALELQQKILLRLSPKKIGELCILVTQYATVLGRSKEKEKTPKKVDLQESLKKLPYNVKAFYDGICTNELFWRAKLHNDFPFNFENLMREKREEFSWRTEYIRLFKNALDDTKSMINGGNGYLIDKLKDRSEWKYGDYVTMLIREKMYTDGLGDKLLKEYEDALEFLKTKIYSIVRWYLTIGVDPNTQAEYDGNTLLMFASNAGHLEVVRLLLEYGANPNIQNEYQLTPLIDASEKGHLEIVRLLLENGADPNRRLHNEDTPLIIASRIGHLEIVRLLLEYGANPNLKNKYGNTPLMLASQKGLLEMVRLLLEHGADPTIKDKYGFFALMYALKQGNNDIVDLLRRGIGEEIETMPDW